MPNGYATCRWRRLDETRSVLTDRDRKGAERFFIVLDRREDGNYRITYRRDNQTIVGTYKINEVFDRIDQLTKEINPHDRDCLLLISPEQVPVASAKI